MLKASCQLFTQENNLQLLVPHWWSPGQKCGQPMVGLAGVLQNTGALLWTLPGGQWTPADPPSSLHRSRLQLFGVVPPVTSKIKPGLKP